MQPPQPPVSAPQRATLLVYEDGVRSQPIEATVEFVPVSEGEQSPAETLVTVLVDYESDGNVLVRVTKGDARNLTVIVDS